MRGTDGANTVVPTTPPTVAEIRAGFVADDFKATTTVASNMRGTEGANTVVPTNETLTLAQNTKLMSLDTEAAKNEIIADNEKYQEADEYKTEGAFIKINSDTGEVLFSKIYSKDANGNESLTKD
jgi:hypothetical protein